VVHPAAGHEGGTLANALAARYPDTREVGSSERPGIVHRLDKDTSGLMVVAKDEQAQAKLSADFAARRVARAYGAVVWGVPQPRAGEIAGRIGRSPRNRQKMAVLRTGGKAAVTRYRVLRAFKDVAALIECRLATGRTHQIRVHLTERGHPLIGDATYGDRRSLGRTRALPSDTAKRLTAFPRQALHAMLIGFDHPVSGEHLEFHSEFPRDIGGLVTLLESV
ncbi:MAG TPA: RluA family pseudouridine synthase, partial [Stellaceae bacterium]|nr:RluA family pseudouridine synthase [Stellaceae bacterium]